MKGRLDSRSPDLHLNLVHPDVWRKRKRPLAKINRRWDDNIKKDLKQDVDDIKVVQDRIQWPALVKTAITLRVQ
jgi:hypothetical protein